MEAQQEVLRALRLLSPPVMLEHQHVTLTRLASFPTRPKVTVLQLCPKAADHEALFNRACVELQLVYPMNQLWHVLSRPAMLAAALSLYPHGAQIGKENGLGLGLSFCLSPPSLSLSFSLS